LKIYIDGYDNIGWSVDQDANHIKSYIESLNYTSTDKWWNSKIVHNTWWDNILIKQNKYMNIFHKKIIVTCSNFIDPSSEHFDRNDKFIKVKKIANAWIAPSSKQYNILYNLGLNVFYLPFSIDLSLFNYKQASKQSICKKYNLDYKMIENRIVIGSFQRDSIGNDLNKPKWQKNPELLIELLKGLDPKRYILLLVGPRRHYVLNQCKKHNISYLYVGKEMGEDDLSINSQDITSMPDFYRLTDLYLITSLSEGGPKAAIEATAMKTFVMSTDVGLSMDFIDNNFIFNNDEKYSLAVSKFVNDDLLVEKDKVIESNFVKCMKLQNKETMMSEIGKIYKAIQ